MTPEERRLRRNEASRRYAAAHPERVKDAQARSRAKTSRREYMASYYEANRERLANYHREYCLMHRRRLRFARYGLTIEDYEAMLAAQLGQCALCQRIPSYELVVDHDHKTGRVRGLLCHRCNAGLGYLGDTTAVLERALRYVDGELNNDDRGRGTYELRTMAAKRA